MRSKIPIWTVGLAMALFLAGAPPVFAEVAADDDDGNIVMGITEGPDPIPHLPWDGDSSGTDVLNAGSDLRNDGRPDIFFDPSDGNLVVAWAYNTGADHDIAFSVWNGTAWETEFLTSSTTDELDPRAYVDGGTYYVTWWEPELERVLLTSRSAQARLWLQPVEVAVDARRPSVALYGEDVMVTFERSSAGGGQEIVLARASSLFGPYSFEVLATIESTEPLDVLLHVSGVHAWIDWKHSSDKFGYIELINGTWSEPTIIPWVDASWLGVQSVRLLVRRAALGS